MPCPVNVGAQETPNHPALITDTKCFSYLELDACVSSFYAQLKQLDVCAEQRVAFVAYSSWQTLVLFLALWRLKAVACPLNFRLPQPQIERAKQRLAAHHFVAAEQFTFASTKHHQIFSWQNDQLATLLFTSGSASEPKIAAHTLGNHLYNALGSNTVLPLLPSDRWLLSLPLFHVGALGIIFRCLLAKSTIVLSSAIRNITHVSLVPTQLYRLLQNEQLPPLKSVLMGGAALSPSLYSQAKERGLNLYSSYGMTEVSSQIATDADPIIAENRVSCGSALPHRELILASDGEILVRGKALFQGYFNSETGLQLPLNSEGWFATSDIGMWTKEGKLIVLGRKDNLFTSGGENIQPEEIEQALLSLPGIIQAFVLPRSDEEFGARPIAFIESEQAYTLEEVRAKLGDLLPRYKLPVQLFSLPKTEEKISRNFLKEVSKSNQIRS